MVRREPGTEDELPSFRADIDPWQRVPFTHLPPELVDALEDKDWPKLKDQLRTVMDSVATETIYGRQLSQWSPAAPGRQDVGLSENQIRGGSRAQRHSQEAKLGFVSVIAVGVIAVGPV